MSTVTENVDKELMLPITIPAGVSASDVTVVNVRVTLATVDNRTIDNVPLSAHNNYNNLAISEIDFTSVAVDLSGSTNNINAVSADDIEVYFEMPQEAGTYTLPLFVTVEDNPYVNAIPQKASVTVTIVEANS